MGADHPVAWCKDYRGGRSFYTSGSTSAIGTETAFADHIAGAVEWSSGVADSVYSDCGATVLANFEQTKISAPPNLNEPIGFDQFPDGRVIQTARGGQVRLHDPALGTEQVIATIPVYTNSEDGLYGPAVDNDFATNHWVYLYYAPPDRHRGAVGRRHPHDHHADRERPHHRGGPVRLGPLARLLPAVAVQVRRRADALARPRLGAEDPPGRQQPRRLLPRRR